MTQYAGATVTEEFLVGDIPPRGGYDESAWGSPTWNDLIYLLNNENINEFFLVPIGKGISSDPNQPTWTPETLVGGVSGKFTKNDILRVPFRLAEEQGYGRSNVGRGLELTASELYTAKLTQVAFGLSIEPIHIAAFAVKKIR